MGQITCLAIALLVSCGCGLTRSRPSETPPVKIEFRRAEDKPGPGLTEASVASTGGKVYLHDRVELSNADIARARVKKGLVGPVVEVKLTEEGAKKFALVTTDRLGKQLAIVVDGQVLSAPIIRQWTSSGELIISGRLTQEQADRIAHGILRK